MNIFVYTAVVMNIRNPETRQLARALADRRGVTMTQAITDALKADLARLPDDAAEIDRAAWRAQIKEIQNSIAKMPVLDTRSRQEIEDELYD